MDSCGQKMDEWTDEWTMDRWITGGFGGYQINFQ